MQQTSPFIPPDGRDVVVRGRLWRTANPNLSTEILSPEIHAALAHDRAAVHAAKVALGGRTALEISIGTWSRTRPTQSGTRRSRLRSLGEGRKGIHGFRDRRDMPAEPRWQGFEIFLARTREREQVLDTRSPSGTGEIPLRQPQFDCLPGS